MPDSDSSVLFRVALLSACERVADPSAPPLLRILAGQALADSVESCLGMAALRTVYMLGGEAALMRVLVAQRARMQGRVE